MRSSPSVSDALADARERTLALVAPLSDADVESQHTEIMSPLVGPAHIAAYEGWLVHRHAGSRCHGPSWRRCTTPSRPRARYAATCRC